MDNTKIINGYVLDAPLASVVKKQMRLKYNFHNTRQARFGPDDDYSPHWIRRLNDKNYVWWIELSYNVTPTGYMFYRKTKAGKWEVVLRITRTKDKLLARAIYEVMFYSEHHRFGKHAAMKVTSLNGRQIFSSYYLLLYDVLTHRFNNDKMFGISLNKGEYYLMFHPTNKEESIKTISNYFYKLSGKHEGIKCFHKAKTDERDGNLFWGWLTFNDGYRMSVALDDEFRLYNEYKSNLSEVSKSYLIKTK